MTVSCTVFKTRIVFFFLFRVWLCFRVLSFWHESPVSCAEQLPVPILILRCFKLSCKLCSKLLEYTFTGLRGLESVELVNLSRVFLY